MQVGSKVSGWFKENACNILALGFVIGAPLSFAIGGVSLLQHVGVQTDNYNRQNMAIAMMGGLRTFSGDRGYTTYAMTQITKSGDCESGTAFAVTTLNGDGTPATLDATRSLTLRVCDGKPMTLAAQ